MTESRRPVHLAVLAGASTATYAIALAGVTALQSSADQAVIELRAPTVEAAAALGEAHDRLEADLAAASDRYSVAADRYRTLASDVEASGSSLETFAARVEQVTGAARSLPTKVALPTVTRTVRTVTVKPTVRSTTGASGR